jgi:hypothetical protein
MKKIAKFLTISVAVLMFSINASAQLTASTSATAVIYSALRISNTQDLDFGVIIPSATLAGSVTITPAGVVTLSNVTAHPSSAPNQALFSVIGEPNENYDISITAAPVTLTSGANTMSISTITSNPAAGVNAGLLSGAGTQTISVGGVLDVAANQVAGTYTNAAAITVTINYN